MPNNNKLILGLLAFAIVFGGTVPGQAKDTKATNEIAAPQVPIVIEANDLSFSEETGDILAKGNVIITNVEQRLEAEQIDGNAKINEIRIKEKSRFFQKDLTLNGTGTVYNYKLKTGSMKQANGQLEDKYIAGETISMSPSQLTINNGTATGCPAKVPDYHISADKIEIWPGDKMIAYNAKVWIGKMVIFTLPKYEQSLKPDAKGSAFPRLGYDSDDGAFIKQHLEYSLSNMVSAYVNLDYYSRSNFKPSYGLIHRDKNYTFSIDQGHFNDDDSHWIKKEPEFKFSYKPQQLGNLPIHYTFSAAYGKWSDSEKTSWHQEYGLYLKHEPIKFGSSAKLNLGTGVQHIIESYDNSTRNVWKFDATFDKQWSERFSTSVGYHYAQNNDALFEYDKTDLSRELKTGFIYKIDKMNAIGISHSYDLDNHEVHDVDYSWYRNLHCWEAKITYRAEREQLRVDVNTIKW
ncbi:LPS-assembly protein LptD [Sporomusa ovata DSM 2662]|uniref:OstA family protein n=1 Tax=Sporomusa ovata TaxID=2378 RepID=A0A0U1KT16_9FIRM|nr:LPS-assembly protein LptD [Sporomusa ovata]EQB26477.1 OstA family protein [Sporomusa ovata DSM 2662]CQR70561.1 OstA family protein [Sporomusa ovata]